MSILLPVKEQKTHRVFRDMCYYALEPDCGLIEFSCWRWKDVLK